MILCVLTKVQADTLLCAFSRVVIRLGYAGVIAAFDIATTHFTGNHAPFASIEGTYSTQETPNPRAQVRATVISIRGGWEGFIVWLVNLINIPPTFFL